MNRFIITNVLCAAVSLLGAGNLVLAEEDEQEGLHIEAQPLSSALREFSEQTGLQIGYAAELAEGKETTGVAGIDDLEVALDTLLAQSGLEHRFVNAETVVIRAAVTSLAETEGSSDSGNAVTTPRPVMMAQAEPNGSSRNREETETEREAKREGLPIEEIIVTGSNIRGAAPDSAPVDIYTDMDIARTGAVTVEQFMATLPQNFNNFSSIAQFAIPNRDTGRNEINLRGLGVGTTLVLLNGRRLVAPGGRSPDISLIPLGAVERIEVLTDGASAVYGSDAIGGVVNIILKDALDGVEAGLTYGAVTAGDHDQFKADLAGGASWESGSISASYNYYDQSALNGEDREYARAALPFTLLPDDLRHSGLVALRQRFAERITFDADILYSLRDYRSVSSIGVFGTIETVTLDQNQLFVNTGLTYKLSDDHVVDVFATYSDFDEDFHLVAINESDGSVNRDVDPVDAGDDLEVGAKLDGVLLRLPAGDLRFAAGGGYGDESYRSVGTSHDEILERDRYYLFGEAYAPLISPEQGVPGAHRLEVNAALRFTDYSDFGSNMSPRLGLLWSPVDGLGLRGTYSEGFRAPGLHQLRSITAVNFLFSPLMLGFPDPFSSDGSSVYLFAQGSNNPNLDAETSRSYTLGFDIEEMLIDGLRISGTYFNIDYRDRIAEPDSSGGFVAIGNPSLFPSLFDADPSPEFIAELLNGARNAFNGTSADINDIDSVVAVTTVAFDNRIQNVARAHVEGFDFGIYCDRAVPLGTLNFGVNATYLLESFTIPAEESPTVVLLNTPANPMDIRFRSFLGLSNDGFAGQIAINYSDSYKDPFQTPPVDIDSWTTVDLHLAYAFDNRGPEALNGFKLSLAVTNLFDQDPPSLMQSDTTNVGLNEPVGFDPANASPVGRFVQLGVRKRF